VQIQRMTPTRSTGLTYSFLAPNVVEPETLPHLPERERVDWAIDPQAGTVRLVDPPIAVADLVLPLRPMIGCFDVAPGHGSGDAERFRRPRLDNKKCAEIPAKRIGPEHPLRSSRLDVRSWLILIRTASTDVLSVLLDCRQGGVKGCEGSMPDAGHWLRNTVGRVS